MNITGTMVNLPVSNLKEACAWYERVLELPNVPLQPLPYVAEYLIGLMWLQLKVSVVDESENYLRFGVEDIDVEHARLTALGVPVGPVYRLPGALAYFEFKDPDGNKLGFYSMLI